MGKRILDIFYNDLIKEASSGKIDCFFSFYVCFYTYIKEKETLLEPKFNLKDIAIPILIINNLDKFNNYLIEYVNLALEFYQDDEYIKELKESEDEEYYKIKMIITLLWSNATVENFNEPEEFLKQRIDYLKNIIIEERVNLGYSEILGTNVEIQFQKERIYNETPNSIVIRCYNEEQVFTFPVIRFGISDDIVYIYALQNIKNQDDLSWSKKVKRKMYKVNEDTELMNSKLKDTTASFVVAGDIFMWIMNFLDYKKFKIIGNLPIRWNSKKIKNSKKAIKGLTDEEKEMFYNATEKLFNTFRRISFQNASFVSNVIKDDLNVNIYDNEEMANNKLLNEMIALSKSYKSQNG